MRKDCMVKLKLNMRTFRKSPRVLIRVFNEKAMFPTSGRGYVVEKLVLPTMKRGSQSTTLKRFKTKKEADIYFNKIKKGRSK